MNVSRRRILGFLLLCMPFLVLVQGCRTLHTGAVSRRIACIEPRPDNGEFIDFTLAPNRIYGAALTYRSHIKETGELFRPDLSPPIFRKSLGTLNGHRETVKFPSTEEMVRVLDALEPGLGGETAGRFATRGTRHSEGLLDPLLDYEAELAFVLLEDIAWDRMDDPAYMPRLGFFVANDLSARTVAALGEGTGEREKFWGASKSFQGFLPTGRLLWVPRQGTGDTVVCVELETTVNGELRQRQFTADLIYTPKQLLSFIAAAYPDERPEKGDVVLTGTPGGVALRVSPWKRRLAAFLHLGRFTRLRFLLNAADRERRFLYPGDELVVSGGVLGEIKTRIVE
jgi:2-keto-4-pentenoate hydratase/2-oxohepta-3-ene-1,7-dioic acid hydratase in catechol pathway